MTKKALFLNGVYDDVLQEIMTSQTAHPGEVFFIQPYKSDRITLLAGAPPTLEEPVRVYMSTTDDLKHVRYVAEIVHWEDKRLIPPDRLTQLNDQIKRLQPKENEIYMTAGRGECTNLLFIKDLRQFPNPFSVSNLTKASDGQPLSSNRNRSGGWSYVFELPSSTQRGHIDKDVFDEDFEAKVIQSQGISSQSRQKRLATAPKIPQKVRVESTAFRRNPDVVAEVLERANGYCEKCTSPAPFLRARDNTPYLEMHHKKTLAQGGEDTVENALALCPNCHRRVHFG